MTNSIRWSRRAPLVAASLLLLGWHAVSLIGFFVADSAPALAATIDRMVNRGGHFGNPEGPVEQFEAVAWLAAFVMYASVAIMRRGGRSWRSAWILALAGLTFVALGEEISWGQHLFGWRAPDVMQQVNFQHETNAHNLDLGAALGLPATSSASRALKLLVRLANPAFFVLCVVVFAVLPTLRERGIGATWSPLASIPIPSRGTRVLCVAGLAAYLLIDKLVVDCGELMELSVALTAALAAHDVVTSHALERYAASVSGCKPTGSHA